VCVAHIGNHIVVKPLRANMNICVDVDENPRVCQGARSYPGPRTKRALG